MTKSFKSKISYGLLVPVLILSIAPAVNILFRDVTTAYMITVLGLVIVLAAAILNVSFGLSYNIEKEKTLVIKTGIFHKSKLEIADISSIAKTRSILSAPAASLDRIEIKYNKHDSIIISPTDQAGFVKELLNINPDIDVDLAAMI